MFVILSLGIVSVNQVSAKPKDLIISEFSASLMGIVSNWGENYTMVQNASIGQSSANSSSTMILGQEYEIPLYFVRRNYFRFDTRILGTNINIQNIRLDVYGLGKFFEPPVESAFRLQKWTDGNNGLNTSDYSKFDGINYDDGSVTWDAWIIGWNNFTVSNESLVSLSDYTDVCLRQSTDIDQVSPVMEETVTVNTDPKVAILTVSYYLEPRGLGEVRPTPPWERVPEQVGQFLRDRITTPFWNMWIQMNMTFEGILASIIIVISLCVGLEFYHWIRKPRKKLKIAKIDFS